MTLADIRHAAPQAIRHDNAKTWPRPFTSRFLEAGLVSYEEQGLGKELLKKETIDLFVQTFAGKPVIIRHSSTNPSNMEGKAVGYVSRVWFEPADGWFYCEGVIKDDGAKTLIENGWSVSCSYHVRSTTPEGGKYHNIDFAREITAFEGEHLALVENPRYEEANIRLNEKPKQNMNVFKIIMKKLGAGRDNAAAEDSVSEVPSDSAVVQHEGKSLKLSDLVANYKAKQAARDNAVAPDSFVEIDGKQVAVKDLLADAPRENAGEDKEEPRDNKMVEDLGGRKGLKAKKGDKKDNEADEDSEEEDKEDKKGRDNSAFDALKNASQNQGFSEDLKAPSFNAMSDKLARGAERYGPIKK